MEQAKATAISKTITKLQNSDPYRMPEETYTFLNVSGGRTSAYMLYKILERYNGKLPENCEALFANTGKEDIKTLDFLKRIEEEWNIKITWLEYEYLPERRGTKNDPRHRHKRINYETASRHGEPFETLIRTKKRPPNVIQRYCTEELKVRTFERYAKREKKLKQYCNTIGIRADEARRLTTAMKKECMLIYPLVYSGTTIEVIERFWKSQNFNLEISSELSNCDLCFLKGKKQIKRLMNQNPEKAKWWIEREDETNGFFRKGTRYRKILNEPKQLEMYEKEEPAINCFCGD